MTSEHVDRSEHNWLDPERNALIRNLEHTLKHVDFPVARDELAARARDVPLLEETEVPPDRYLEALPDRTYQAPEDVMNTVDARWSRLRRLRGG